MDYHQQNPQKKTAESETEKKIDPINDKQHYFWVKLHHDFFDTLIIKKLRIKEKGDTLALLYQRVILLSLKHNGYICYEGMGDDITEEISIATGENIDDCRVLVNFLLDNGQATLSDDKSYIYIYGYEDCTGADKPKTRMKNSRIRKKQQEQNNMLSQIVTALIVYSLLLSVTKRNYIVTIQLRKVTKALQNKNKNRVEQNKSE